MCGEAYSYGRFICHDCEDNSIIFGKIFEKKHKIYKWNCSTAMISMELMNRELKSIESIIEKVPDNELKDNIQYEWNCDYTMRLNDIQQHGRKLNPLHIYE
jgi:hypothetical protein